MQRFLILSLMALTLMACTSGSGSNGELLGLQSGPTQAISLDAGIDVAERFLDAWAAQDYVTMYSLISPNARDAYPEADFTEIYQSLWNDLRLSGLAWQRGQALLQGTTAVIEYDVNFDSLILNEFTDPNRLMRLIPTDEGMRIAWSRMDIFEGWAGGANLRIERFLASRGNIFDVNGRALADQNGVALPLYLVKNNMSSIVGCIDVLAPLLGLEYQDLDTLFARYNPDTLFLAGEIDPEIYQSRGVAIDNACRPQIGERRTRRYFASAAPHTVGYIAQIPVEQAPEYDAQGYPQDALVGVAGIEQSWEQELRGTIGNRLSLFSVTEERLRVITQKEATPGESVYLTLNRDLQQGLTEAFADAYTFAETTWSRTSPGAAAVIIDVKTGAIRGMVSYPTFDPAVFNPDSPYLDPGTLIQQYNTDIQTPLLNRATQGRYPLGSVFKMVSTIAGAETGLMPLDTLNNCTGTWNGEIYGDIVRTDWFREGHGVLDGRGAVINSCNPYYWQIGVALNSNDPFLLPQYARLFGFGNATGLRGVAEDAGFISDPDIKAQQGFTWGQADASNMVIGQGDMAVTPLQTALYIAAIANGGRLYRPYLVDRVQLIGEDPSYTATPEFEELGLDPFILAEVRQAMCDVTQIGTAGFIYNDWYNFHANAVIVCGKTGTAQAGNREPHAWFGAFAPADDPEIAIAVVVENSCEGSEVAAPIVRRIVEIYYGLPEFGWPAPIWQGACSEIVVE